MARQIGAVAQPQPDNIIFRVERLGTVCDGGCDGVAPFSLIHIDQFERGQRRSLFDPPVEIIMDGLKCNPARHKVRQDEQPDKHQRKSKVRALKERTVRHGAYSLHS